MATELKKAIATPLTNFDLEKYLDTQDHILRYDELDKFSDLEQLLPYHKAYKIILIEYENNSGHWICVLRYRNIIEFFNSFGVKHSEDDFVGSKEYNAYLGQYALFLDELAQKEANEGKFELIYNKVKFQKKSRTINTCGRWILLRILCMLYYDMNLGTFISFMKKSRDETGFTYDELAATIIA